MTLNGVIAIILRYFTEFDSFAVKLTDYVTVVEDNVRKISFYSFIWPKLTHRAVARSFCDS